MPLVCIHCAMRAKVAGEAWPTGHQPDETIAEHMRRCHPNPDETERERAELEAKLTEMYLRGEL